MGLSKWPRSICGAALSCGTHVGQSHDLFWIHTMKWLYDNCRMPFQHQHLIAIVIPSIGSRIVYPCNMPWWTLFMCSMEANHAVPNCCCYRVEEQFAALCNHCNVLLVLACKSVVRQPLGSSSRNAICNPHLTHMLHSHIPSNTTEVSTSCTF